MTGKPRWWRGWVVLTYRNDLTGDAHEVERGTDYVFTERSAAKRAADSLAGGLKNMAYPSYTVTAAKTEVREENQHKPRRRHKP